jgi:hypothetical protein
VELDITTDEDAVVYINGEVVEMEGRHVTLSHPVEEGLQDILVRVEDPVGNWMDHPPVHVEVDWSPPALHLDDGLPETTEEALFRLLGTTEPNCTVTVNGVRVSVDGSGAFVRNFLLNEGDNTLVVVSTDRYGQSSNASHTVRMVAPEPEPWPEAPSLLPMLLALTAVLLAVEVVVLRLYWRRNGTRDHVEGA